MNKIYILLFSLLLCIITGCASDRISIGTSPVSKKTIQYKEPLYLQKIKSYTGNMQKEMLDQDEQKTVLACLSKARRINYIEFYDVLGQPIPHRYVLNFNHDSFDNYFSFNPDGKLISDYKLPEKEAQVLKDTIKKIIDRLNNGVQ